MVDGPGWPATSLMRWRSMNRDMARAMVQGYTSRVVVLLLSYNGQLMSVDRVKDGGGSIGR